MIDADKALRIVLDSVRILGHETVKLEEALGRVLAEDVVANQDIPPFPNSSMDGYAIVASDLACASSRVPVKLRVIGESSAGSPFRRGIKGGRAVRIMTGGMIPRGADAVVPIELTKGEKEGWVSFTAPILPGQNVRAAGEDIRHGEKILSKGTKIGPAQTGILSSLGHVRVKVIRRPRINVLATGNELVDTTRKPKSGQIRNSTSHSLSAYVAEEGGVPFRRGVAGDDVIRLQSRIKDALDCDILLITGGVSVGRYDYVKDVLKKIGVTIKFWQVNIKPGRPLVFGKFRKTLVFGLPGNPVSTSVTFLQFVRPAMRAMTGRTFKPFLVPARIDHDFSKSDGKRHYVRCKAEVRNGEIHARQTGSQSSGVMSSMSKANALMIIPEKVKLLKTGDRVQLELLSHA